MARLAVLDDPPPMPTRPLLNAAGEETTLAELAGGQVMVVNLWGTFCPPCVYEMPTLAALQQRFEGRLRVIPVSADADVDAEKARAQLAELTDNTLPFVRDGTRGIVFDLRAPGMPTTIIYNRRGEEVARFMGDTDWGGDDAARVMEAVLAEE